MSPDTTHGAAVARLARILGYVEAHRPGQYVGTCPDCGDGAWMDIAGHVCPCCGVR